MCQKKGTRTESDAAYMQQCEGLSERGIKNPDPRKQAFDDITTLISEWRLKGYHPIVMGDLNSTPNDPELLHFMEVNGLIDL